MGGINQAAVAFDEPILYKDIELYPATVKDYTVFKECSNILTLNMMSEQDINLLGLPYLEYVYRKSKTEEGSMLSLMLLMVLSIVLKNDKVHFYEDENGDVFLNIFKQNSQYDALIDEYTELYSKYQECVNVDQMSGVAKALEARLLELKQQMFNTYTLNATEFDELKHLICEQNDIDETVIDPAWEAELKKAREKIGQVDKKRGGLEFRDLLIAVSYDLKKTPDEIADMSIATFDRYIDIMLRREAFGIGKAAEANGAKFKKPIEHWLRHYTPKGKYDDVQVDAADSFVEDLNE